MRSSESWLLEHNRKVTVMNFEMPFPLHYPNDNCFYHLVKRKIFLPTLGVYKLTFKVLIDLLIDKE